MLDTSSLLSMAIYYEPIISDRVLRASFYYVYYLAEMQGFRLSTRVFMSPAILICGSEFDLRESKQQGSLERTLLQYCSVD